MSNAKIKRGRPSDDGADQQLGDKVRVRRQLVGMTQARLGEALGVSFQQVQKYERGANRISASRLRQIAEALDVPVSLFYETAGANENAAVGPETPAVAEAQRLGRAFERVEDAQVRHAIIALVEAAATLP